MLKSHHHGNESKLFISVGETEVDESKWKAVNGELVLNDKLVLSTYLSHLVGKPTMWFLTRSDTNRPVQSQKQARSLKFWS